MGKPGVLTPDQAPVPCRAATHRSPRCVRMRSITAITRLAAMILRSPPLFGRVFEVDLEHPLEQHVCPTSGHGLLVASGAGTARRDGRMLPMASDRAWPSRPPRQGQLTGDPALDLRIISGECLGACSLTSFGRRPAPELPTTKGSGCLGLSDTGKRSARQSHRCNRLSCEAVALWLRESVREFPHMIGIHCGIREPMSRAKAWPSIGFCRNPSNGQTWPAAWFSTALMRISIDALLSPSP